MTPKNPRIAQKGTQKSGINPEKVPKIMAHPRIKTYACKLTPRDSCTKSPQKGNTKRRLYQLKCEALSVPTTHAREE